MIFSRPFLHRRVDNTDYTRREVTRTLNSWTHIRRYFKTMNIQQLYIYYVLYKYKAICIEADMPGCCPFFVVMGVYEHRIKSIP